MNFEHYQISYVSILLLIAIIFLVVIEVKEPLDKQTFITRKNFYNLISMGASFLLLGIFFHLTFGQFGSQPVEAPPNETILDLLMLRHVSYHSSGSIALGYGFLFGAFLLKISNIYFIFRNKNENDI